LADRSFRPEDTASLRQLNAELAGITDRLAAARAEARQIAAELDQGTARAEQRLARTAEVPRKRAAEAAEREVPASEQGARASRAKADADERSARAARERQRAVEREVQEQRRGNVIYSSQPGQRPGVVYSQRPGARTAIPSVPAPAPAPTRGSLRDVLPPAAAGTRAETTAAKDAAAAERIRAQELGHAREAARSTLASAQQYSGALQYSTRVIGSNSDALRRHGALTSEFISAAARGQVEIRELGYQVGATIGKFAGWTLAATAVFGVVGALHSVAEGAQSANQGLAELERFTPNLDRRAATKQFVDISRQTNVPVSQVAETESTFARIFPNLHDQGTATKTALLATKLDAVSAADSYRYFTGIVQEFNLHASDMPLVLDQISAAQRRLGARVSETLPALARSSAAVRATGDGTDDAGIRHRLIALAAVAQVASGQTGPVVGQSFSRGASNFYRSAKSVPVERAFGLDPNEEFTTFMLHAIQRAASLNGRQRQQLGRAIGGPAFGARIITQLLGQEPRVERALAVTAPRAARGSTADELRDKLKGVHEQLQQVPNELQRIGVELGRLGAFNLFGGALHGLNALLHGTESLLRVFELLPDGPRQVVFTLGEAAAAIGLLRRVDVGRLFPKGSLAQGVLGRSERGSLRSQIYSGLGDERTFLADRRRSVSTDLGLTSYRHSREVDRLRALEAEGGDAEAINRQRSSVVAAQERINALTIEERDLAALEANTIASRTAFMRQTSLRGGLQDPARAAAGLGIPYARGDLAEPTTAPVRALGGARDFAGIVAGDPRNANIARAYAGQMQQTEREVGRFHTFLQAGGRSGVAVSNRLQAANARLPALRGALGRVGTGIKGLATGLASALGPLDLLFLGIPALLEVNSLVHSRSDAIRQQTESLKTARTPTDIRAAIKRVHETPLDHVQGALSDVGNTLTAPARALGIGGKTTTNYRQEVEDRNAANKRLALIQDANQHGVLLSQAQIRRNLQARVSRAKNAAELDAALTQSNKEWERSLVRMGQAAGLPAAGRAAQQASANTKRMIQQAGQALAHVGKNLQDALDAVAQPEDIPAVAALLANRFSQTGSTHRNALFAGQAAATFRAQAMQHLGNPQLAQQYFQAADQAEQSGLQAAQQRLQTLTYSGAPPAQASAARQEYVRRARDILVNGPRKRADHLRSQAADLRKQLGELERQLRGAQDHMFAGIPGLEGLRDPTTAARRGRANKLRSQIGALSKAIDAVTGNSKERHAELRAAVAEQQAADRQQQTETFDAATALATSRTADPLAQARITASRLHQRIGMLRRLGASAAEIDQAIAQYNQALQSVAQASAQRYQLTLQLGQSRADIGATQGAQLQHSLQTARSYAAFVKAQGSKLDPAEYLNAAIAVNQARGALADYARQQAQAMSQARTAYEQAVAGDDPVKSAIAQLHGSERELRLAQTPADRLSARANIINSRRQVRQSRQQEAYDEIQFEADIGKLTHDAELKRLRMLLKTIHGNRDLRRQLRRQIYQLTHDDAADNWDMNLGDVRLPTLYEARRALATARGGSNVTQTTYQTQITVSSADEAARIAAKIDRYHRTTGAAKARAAGRR
jgi:hypothetical protein